MEKMAINKKPVNQHMMNAYAVGCAPYTSSVNGFVTSYIPTPHGSNGLMQHGPRFFEIQPCEDKVTAASINKKRLAGGLQYAQRDANYQANYAKNTVLGYTPQSNAMHREVSLSYTSFIYMPTFISMQNEKPLQRNEVDSNNVMQTNNTSNCLKDGYVFSVEKVEKTLKSASSLCQSYNYKRVQKHEGLLEGNIDSKFKESNTSVMPIIVDVQSLAPDPQATQNSFKKPVTSNVEKHDLSKSIFEPENHKPMSTKEKPARAQPPVQSVWSIGSTKTSAQLSPASNDGRGLISKTKATYRPATCSLKNSDRLNTWCESNNRNSYQEIGIDSRFNEQSFDLRYKSSIFNLDIERRKQSKDKIEDQKYCNASYRELPNWSQGETFVQHTNSQPPVSVLKPQQMSLNDKCRNYRMKQTSPTLSVKPLVEMSPKEVLRELASIHSCVPFIGQNNSVNEHNAEIHPFIATSKNDLGKQIYPYEHSTEYKTKQMSSNILHQELVQRTAAANYLFKNMHNNSIKHKPVHKYNDGSNSKYTINQICSNSMPDMLMQKSPNGNPTKYIMKQIPSNIQHRQMMLEYGNFAKFTTKQTKLGEPLHRNQENVIIKASAPQNNPMQDSTHETDANHLIKQTSDISRRMPQQKSSDKYYYKQQISAIIPKQQPTKISADQKNAFYQSNQTSDLPYRDSITKLKNSLQYPGKPTSKLMATTNIKQIPLYERNSTNPKKEALYIPQGKQIKMCANKRYDFYPSIQTSHVKSNHLVEKPAVENPRLTTSPKSLKIGQVQSCINVNLTTQEMPHRGQLQDTAYQHCTQVIDAATYEQFDASSLHLKSNDVKEKFTDDDQATFSNMQTLNDIVIRAISPKENLILDEKDTQVTERMICPAPLPLEKLIGKTIVKCERMQKISGDLNNHDYEGPQKITENCSPCQNITDRLEVSDLHEDVKKCTFENDSRVSSSSSNSQKETNSGSITDSMHMKKTKLASEHNEEHVEQNLNDSNITQHSVQDLDEITLDDYLLNQKKNNMRIKTTGCVKENHVLPDYSIVNIMTCKESTTSRPVLFYKKGESLTSLMHNMSATNMSADMRELFEDSDSHSCRNQIFVSNLKVVVEKLPPDFDYQVYFSADHINTNTQQQSKNDVKVFDKRLTDLDVPPQDRLKQVKKRPRDDQENTFYPEEVRFKKTKYEHVVSNFNSMLQSTSQPSKNRGCYRQSKCNVNIKHEVNESKRIQSCGLNVTKNEECHQQDIKRDSKETPCLKELNKTLLPKKESKDSSAHNIPSIVKHRENDGTCEPGIFDFISHEIGMQNIPRDSATKRSDQPVTIQQYHPLCKKCDLTTTGLLTNNNMNHNLNTLNNNLTQSNCVHPFKDLIKKYNMEQSQSTNNLKTKTSVEEPLEKNQKIGNDTQIIQKDNSLMKRSVLPGQQRSKPIEVPEQNLVNFNFNGVRIPCITRCNKPFLPLNYIHLRFFPKKPLAQFRRAVQELHVNKREMSVAEQKLLEPILRKYNIKSSKLIMFSECVENFQELIRKMEF